MTMRRRWAISEEGSRVWVWVCGGTDIDAVQAVLALLGGVTLAGGRERCECLLMDGVATAHVEVSAQADMAFVAVNGLVRCIT